MIFATGPVLQPMVVDTPLPFSHGVVMTTGGGAEADRETVMEAFEASASVSKDLQTRALNVKSPSCRMPPGMLKSELAESKNWHTLSLTPRLLKQLHLYRKSGVTLEGNEGSWEACADTTKPQFIEVSDGPDTKAMGASRCFT